MPRILSEDLAGEWICGGLTETRVTEIATFQIPPDQMEAYSIGKDFLAAQDPVERFVYEDLSDLVI